MHKIYLAIGLQITLSFFGEYLNAQQQLSNSGNLYLHPGTQITFFGSFNNTGAFTDSAQKVSFSGGANQDISGNALLRFTDLEVNNPAGVTMQSPLEVSNSLSLLSGPLKLNSNTLTISSNSTSAINRTNGYLLSDQTNNSGKISRAIGSQTGSYTFPFGTNLGEYIPFTLNLTSGDIGNVTVATYPTAVNNTPYPFAPVAVTHVNDSAGNDNSLNVVDRFWQIDKDGPAGIATLTFTAAANEIGTIAGLTAQRWNAPLDSWESPLPGQSAASNNVTVPGVTEFSTWTLTGNGSLLPIKLLTFNAVLNGDQVDINWTTASETNNDFFTIERTIDGISYETVVMVEGAGNSTSMLNYSTTDHDPYYGASYYRLKQTDFNGNQSYSSLEEINRAPDNTFTVAVFPNPIVNEINITIAGETGKEVVVVLRDVTGKECYSKVITIKNENETLKIPRTPSLVSGLYTITISSPDNFSSSRIVIE